MNPERYYDIHNPGKQSALEQLRASRLDTAEETKVTALPVGTFSEIDDRGIDEITCREYDYQQTLLNGVAAHLAMLRGPSGAVQACKIRKLPKQFSTRGDMKKVQLFGQHLGSGDTLVITEGEIDAMAVKMAMKMMKSVIPVSIVTGAQSCESNLKNNLEYILSFKKVVIFFDNDEPGQKASLKAAEVIGGRVAIVTGFAYKDAGEAWKAGYAEAIREAIKRATPHRPEGIVQADNLMDQVMNPDHSRGLDLRWSGWNNATKGFRPGELWLLAGGSGIGKSLFTRSMALHLCRNGTKVAYIGLEEKASTTLERMLSEECGIPIHLMGREQRMEHEEMIRNASKRFAPNLLLLDKFGSDDLTAFKNKVRFYVDNEQCKVVFLDHFSLLADGIALNVDQRRAIDKAIKELKELAMEKQFTFVVVSHLSRPALGPAHEEGGSASGPSLAELRGSHSLAQIPDYILMLQRSPLDETEPNTTKVWLKKNRMSGTVGLISKLKFDPRTCQFDEEFAITPTT